MQYTQAALTSTRAASAPRGTDADLLISKGLASPCSRSVLGLLTLPDTAAWKAAMPGDHD